MRTIFLVIFAGLMLTGCGTVCDGVAASEQRANQKALNCNLTNITVHDANKCNSGLSKCSSDDVTELKNYAACLDALPQCSSSNETSFNFSRAGCVLQPVGRVSATCLNAIL